jgi:hypothetical protein
MTELFIQKATDVHGDKYDYSKTEYVNEKTRVIIICKEHGEFEQIPSSHKIGSGCRKCGFITRNNKRTMQNKEFIKNAILVHGDKYDYSKTDYVNNLKEVIIICKEHGQFLQLPKTHKRGNGCHECGRKKTANTRKMTTEEFIENASQIHGNIYNYSKTLYKKSIEKVIIICKEHGEFEQTPNRHLCGHGCQICAHKKISNSRKMTTEQFIENAKLIHVDKYDYSKVEYNINSENVIIICKKHGEFEQTPNGHLASKGCRECSILVRSEKKPKTTKQFIEEAIQIHGNIYDYSKVEYINCNTNVMIICKEHGEFEQKPTKHLCGHGCQLCGINKLGKWKLHNTQSFINKAILIHGDKYDYSKTDYIKSLQKVIIICKEHGEFEQVPYSHLQGCGCNLCGINLRTKNQSYTIQEFINKSRIIHEGKYDYSKVEYVNNHTKINIICNKHGLFEQTPQGHISGRGCIKCAKKYSKSQIKWLDFISSYNQIKIQHAENGGEYVIPNTRFKADGYCQETNTIFEFHGDLWHGNPKLYNQEDRSFFGKTYGELHEKTIKREQEIRDMGFNLVVMWESDWNKINNSIRTIQNIFRLFK